MYSFAKDILKLLKDNETNPKDDPKEEEPVQATLKYRVINVKTEPQITALLIQQLITQLEQIEVLFLNVSKPKDDDPRNVIYKRVRSICSVFAPLLQARLSPHNHEAVGKLIVQFYKLLHMFTIKVVYHLLLIARLTIIQYNESEEEPSPAYSNMIEVVGKNITPVVYNLMWYVFFWTNTNADHLHVLSYITSHSDSKVTEAKIEREIRHFPNVIFWIEKFESVLIKVSERHELKIYEKFRRSTARDFRILDNKLDVAEDDDEGEKKSKKRKGSDKENKVSKKQKTTNEDE